MTAARASSCTGTATVTDLPVTGATNNFTAVEGQRHRHVRAGDVHGPQHPGDGRRRTAALPSAAGATARLPPPGTRHAHSPADRRHALTTQQIRAHRSSRSSAATPTPRRRRGHARHAHVVITTLGGATTTLTSPPGGGVTVADAPLTGTAGNEITGIEGITTGTVLLGTFIDANPGATVADYTSGGGSVVVNWGDGSAPQTLAAANLTAVGTPERRDVDRERRPHLCRGGTYAYTVTVTDDGGSSTIVAGSAIIADAALAAGGPGPDQHVRGGPVPRSGRQRPRVRRPRSRRSPTPTSISTIADFKAKIDWGDGTPLTAGTISQPGGAGTAYIVSGAHTYADSGVNGGTGHYTIQVFVVDDGGSMLTVDNTANVADDPIVLTGLLNPENRQRPVDRHPRRHQLQAA